MAESYIDACQDGLELVCWVRKENGELETRREPLSDYLYCFVPDKEQTFEYRDIHNQSMRKVSFSNHKEMKEYAKNRSYVCESDISPVYRYLIDNFTGANQNSAYNLLEYDIEVDVDLRLGKGYSSIKDPFMEINAISTFHEKKQRYMMFIPKKLKGVIDVRDNREGYPVDVYWSASERDMLLEFCSYIEDIDFMTAWNGDGFDLPYMMERLLVNFGDDGEWMLCREGIRAQKREYVNKYDQEVWSWKLRGRVHMDMMELYKKFVPGEKPSFSLDAISEMELGEEKLCFDEKNLGDLSRGNPNKFYDYSLHDSRLLKMLEKKKQIIRMAVAYARESCVLLTDATGSVKPIEHGFISFCREKNNIVLPNKRDVEAEEFEGAIVYTTISGRHGHVFTVDLTALYPSCMILLGLSSETLLMQCEDTSDDYVRIMSRSDDLVTITVESDKSQITLPAHEMNDIIHEAGYTISGYGTIFDGSLGLLSEFVQHTFQTRVNQKGLMKEAFVSNDNALGELYNLLQSVTKIRCNSLYGCIGNRHFRLYDPRIAASITATGRIISKQQAVECNDLINELASLCKIS
jgi:DNA polymerase elongation subunit (family B)